MSLYAKLKDAVALNSDSRATLEMYWHWSRQFHRFNGKRASEWTGGDVQRFMVHIHAQSYSRSSRKSALCAMAYIFKHVLKALDALCFLPHNVRCEIQHGRKAVWKMERASTGFERPCGQVKMVLPVRLWRGAERDDAGTREWTVNGMRKGTMCRSQKARCAQDARICRLDMRKAALSQSALQKLPPVGRQGNSCVRGMEKRLRRFLVSYWRTPIKKTFFGTNQYGRQLPAGKRALGITRGADEQQANQHHAPVRRSHSNDRRVDARIGVPEALDLSSHLERMERFNGNNNTTQIYAHADAARGVSPMDGSARTTFPTVNFLN